MKSRTIFILIGFAVIVLLLLILFRGKIRERRLMKEGNEIISDVENYKIKKGTLPSSASGIGREEGDGYHNAYYQKLDSLHYIVAFGVDFDESAIYYSDSKKWETKFRVVSQNGH